MLRRQHPTTGVVIVAAALEPALMLEAMRAGVTEFLTAPVTATELTAAVGRVTTAHRADDERRGLRVSRRQGRRWNDNGRNQRRDDARTDREWVDVADRPPSGVRRRRCLPGDRAALLRHRRARERASARQDVLERPRGPCARRPVATGLVRSRQRDASRHDERSYADRVCGVALPLRRARRSAHRT